MIFQVESWTETDYVNQLTSQSHGVLVRQR
jgi:hypothetical protein